MSGRSNLTAAATLPFTTIAKEQQTGLTAPREEVVTTASRWSEVWAEIVATRSPKPAPPDVDFTRLSLILVARGETGDSCRTIEIEHVELRDGSYSVHVQDARRPMTCTCPPVTVQPIHVVAVARGATQAEVWYRQVTLGDECR